MTGRVLFVSDHDLERAENLRAIYNAYPGPKDFVKGMRYMQGADRAGYSVVVFDTLPPKFEKLGTCKFICIGHGIFGGKLYGLDEKRAGIARDALRKIDYVICSSPDGIAITSGQYGIPPERVLPIGMPRTDSYFGARKGDGRTALSPSGRNYLYAPTFRNWCDPIINWENVESLLKRDELLVIKRHYFKSGKLLVGACRRIVEVGPQEASAPYLKDCDAVITDYSSILFDAYLLGKPVVLFAPDADRYISDRGMYYEYPAGYSDMVASTMEEAIEMCRTLCETGMTSAMRDISDLHSSSCDGHSCERLVEVIEDILKGEVEKTCREFTGGSCDGNASERVSGLITDLVERG